MAIRKYSKGMMQRLGLAQALLHDPELVILDEPMSGLDPMGRMDVRGIITGVEDGGPDRVLQQPHHFGRGGALRPGHPP